MKPFLLLLFCAITLSVAAQTNTTAPVVFTHIDEENGLSDNHTTAVFKDAEGFVWVGTKDGLNLLDGSTIRIFKNKPTDSNSICYNYITGITGDINGDVWISTASGVCCYKKKEKKFFTLKNTDKATDEIGGVCNIVTDKNNCLWFGTGHGLFQYDIAAHKLRLYSNNSTTFESDTVYSNKINHIIISADNTIWLSTADGLWTFSSSSKIFTKAIHKKNDPLYNPLCQYVYEDDDKNIWAGFWASGLKKYDPITRQVTNYGKGLNYSYAITSIAGIKNSAGEKILWLNGSLLAFNTTTVGYFHFQQPVNENEPFNVWPVYSSDNGWVWLASDNGLYIYNPQQQLFRHDLFKKDITSQSVCLLNYKNALLTGGQGKSFLTLKTEAGTILKDYSYLCRNTAAMLCMLQTGEDDFWMSCTEGIIHTNLATNNAKWFQHKEGDSTSLPRNFITSLFIDSKKNLWVFPWREGIWQMDPETGNCKKMWDGFINVSGKIKKLLISDAKEDAKGNIWMADLDEGIVLYDIQSKKFSKPFEKEIGERVHTARIFLKNGKMYSATPAAIIRWDAGTRKEETILLPAELNKGITDLYPDNDGNWWLSTASGLIVYDEKNNSFHRFTTADGLYENNITGNLFCTANNAMAIASPDYFSFFNPELLNNSSAAGKNIIVTDFIAGNRNIETNTTASISLNHNENNITIRWALPVYNNPLHNQYYYQLQGIDADWHFAGNKGEVQYANLSSGHYTILLKAATANKIESANIITIHFSISPPFWKTWWFISLIILAIGSLFFVIVRYVSQRNLKEKLLRLEKEQAIEKERNRISRDMHDDLGSGLTKIAILSEVVKKQMNEPEKAKKQLETISESSRELVDNLQDIIWVLNPKNDTLESLAAYIREYGLKFFEPLGTPVTFDYPDIFSAQKLSEETRRNIFLVIKESLNNIAKHALANQVQISIQENSPSISITIRDNGKGFVPGEVRPFSNGLVNMKNRIEQIGGTYLLQSTPGKGTYTVIKISV